VYNDERAAWEFMPSALRSATQRGALKLQKLPKKKPRSPISGKRG